LVRKIKIKTQFQKKKICWSKQSPILYPMTKQTRRVFLFTLSCQFFLILENHSNRILNTEESENKNANKHSLFYINNSNDETDFEKFYQEMNMKLTINENSNRI